MGLGGGTPEGKEATQNNSPKTGYCSLRQDGGIEDFEGFGSHGGGVGRGSRRRRSYGLKGVLRFLAPYHRRRRRHGKGLREKIRKGGGHQALETGRERVNGLFRRSADVWRS